MNLFNKQKSHTEKYSSEGVCKRVSLLPSKCFSEQFHIFYTEKYSSGRRGVTRNLVGLLQGARVQIPSPPPKIPPQPGWDFLYCRDNYGSPGPFAELTASFNDRHGNIEGPSSDKHCHCEERSDVAIRSLSAPRGGGRCKAPQGMRIARR